MTSLSTYLASKGHNFDYYCSSGCSDTMQQGRLTTAQRTHLAREISCQNMESIALGYLGFDQEVIDSLKKAHTENTEAFNREILYRWANQNPGNDQVQVREHYSCTHSLFMWVEFLI